jgi:aryl-alcohol dehydrogenase-like predicted oxidoreductase
VKWLWHLPQDKASPYSIEPIGNGTTRLTGRNLFGPPRDRTGAVAELREAVELGGDHIETSEYYGPAVVNGCPGSDAPEQKTQSPGDGASLD